MKSTRGPRIPSKLTKLQAAPGGFEGPQGALDGPKRRLSGPKQVQAVCSVWAATVEGFGSHLEAVWKRCSSDWPVTEKRFGSALAALWKRCGSSFGTISDPNCTIRLGRWLASGARNCAGVRFSLRGVILPPPPAGSLRSRRASESPRRLLGRFPGIPSPWAGLGLPTASLAGFIGSGSRRKPVLHTCLGPV